MCEYKSKKELKHPKSIFNEWIRNVQKRLRKEGIRFNIIPIGSGKRNMVVKQCNRTVFDLDYNLLITRLPKEWEINKCCKKLKYFFKKAFDDLKPTGFKDMEDSTQALSTKNQTLEFGYDVVITIKKDDDLYILYNKKNTNGSNNNDYSWEIRSELKGVTEITQVKGPDMWNYLRKNYLNKRHKYKDQQEPNKKHSYQILNESINETLVHFSK